MAEYQNNKPHICKELERRYRHDSAPCHVNGNAKTSEVTRSDEYTKLLNNIVEKMAKRLIESGEDFSTLNHIEPQHFYNALCLAVDYSGFGAGDWVINPNTGDSIGYRYLVSLEFETAVAQRAEQLLQQDYERWQVD